MSLTPVPIEVTRSVKENYENVELLDDSQVYSLHRLVSEAYAAGWQNGHDVGVEETRAVL